MTMNFEQEAVIPLAQLREFVAEAKKRGFAGTDMKSTMSDQTSVYSFRPFTDRRFRGMIYTDMYKGNTVEAGRESVTIDLVLRWENHYYGGTRQELWDVTKTTLARKKFGAAIVSSGRRFPEVVARFLKAALLAMPQEFPVRGPRELTASEIEFEGMTYPGEWRYTNEWRNVAVFEIEDPFAAFVGEEHISLNGVDVYWHGYHGGLVRDKYFPSVCSSR